MGKKLKLGFAMGGGVSLGTFSGSALTETIKQFMVYGKDKEGNQYEEVIIDVFSGASAGAISLLVMLRGLYHYEDKLLQLTKLDRFKGLKTKNEIKAKIKNHLILQFKEAFHQMNGEKQEKLIAVQATQELQRLTWVKEANIENIARLKDSKSKNLMLSKGSILDRDFLVYDMASKAIYFDDNETAASTNIKPVGPLADRVLYACTLTRIEPRLITGEKFHEIPESDLPEERKRKEDLNKLYDKILTDGASSKTHKDLRIFDICFDEIELDHINSIEKHPPRWINIHAGKSIKQINNSKKNLWSYRKSEGDKDFKQENTWIEMVCTAMAAGSFPIAFEPVILKRYASELTQSEKEILKKKGGEDFLRFSYIDGGTFNNEPISEAFKLAGFVDNQDLDGIQGKSFDRKIIFVDPNIGETTTIDNFDYLREFKLNPHKNKPTQRTGLEKITQLIPPIISLLRNEGSIVELDKAKEVINKFKISDNLKKNYKATIRNGFPSSFDERFFDKEKENNLDTEINEMIDQVQDYLDKASNQSMIPRTYKNLNLAIRKHIVNDINSGTFYFSKKLQTELNNLEKIPGYSKFFFSNKPFTSHPSYFQDWLISLYFILLELSQNLVEKNKLSKIIPIGPINITDDGEIKNIELKGSAISAFHGFFSEEFRTHDFNQGIYSAIKIFHYLDNSKKENKKLQIKSLGQLFPEKEANIDLVNKKLYDVVKKRIFDEILKDNLTEITLDSNVRKRFFENLWGKLAGNKITNGYLNIGFWFAKRKIKKSITNLDSTKKSKEILLEFRIKIPKDFKKHVITDRNNSKWVSDIKPIFIKEDTVKEGSYFFVIILKYQFKEGKKSGIWINWEGKKISKLIIAKNRKFPFKDQITHEIALPKYSYVKELLENGLYNYFKLDLKKIKPKGEEKPWKESREEASSLAGLIFGKRQQKNK